jgi:hypothetical protein
VTWVEGKAFYDDHKTMFGVGMSHGQHAHGAGG